MASGFSATPWGPGTLADDPHSGRWLRVCTHLDVPLPAVRTLGAGAAPGHSRNKKDRKPPAEDNGVAAFHNYKKDCIIFFYICRNKVAMD